MTELVVIEMCAELAFEKLNEMILLTENFVEFTDEMKQYCNEWLFDCVHDTGYCDNKTILEIINGCLEYYKPNKK